MSLREILYAWSHIECLRFALWCAKRVQHLNKHTDVSTAIDAAESYLIEQSEKNRYAANTAAYAAYAAANTAYANVAAYAADAAYAAARTAANAADQAAAYAYAAASAAASAAADAASAINGLENMSITDLQLLDLYLSEQLLDIVSV